MIPLFYGAFCECVYPCQSVCSCLADNLIAFLTGADNLIAFLTGAQWFERVDMDMQVR